MGKAYQKLGDAHQAQMNFSWAQDLDPKGAAGASGPGNKDPSMGSALLSDPNLTAGHGNYYW